MGVVDDLARAREAYERGDWSRPRGLVRVRPGRASTPDLSPRRRRPYLLGDRRVRAVRHACGVRRSLRRVRRPRAVRCASTSRMIVGTGGEHALAAGLDRPAPSGSSTSMAGTSVERGYVALPADVRAPGGGDFEGARRLAAEVRPSAGEPGSRPARRSGWLAVVGPGSTGVGCRTGLALVRRGDGSASRRADGLAGGLRRRLLHGDRGLPGDRRLRPCRRMDDVAPGWCDRATRPGGVHRASAPCTVDS